jgi:hypothetical protein
LTFRNEHFSVLISVLHDTSSGNGARTWRGRIPTQWCDRVFNTSENRPSGEILKDLQLVGRSHLTRENLREICRDNSKHVLAAYICTMAWGAQGTFQTVANARDAWAHRDAIATKLLKLRSGNLSRVDAYNLFAGTNAVSGLGPAYFTKLLFFFSPSKSNYIMDQWTTKSMILLTGDITLVQMSPGNHAGPTGSNDGETYKRFCEAIDCLAAELKLAGDKTEELIFSAGGNNRKAGRWRRHVRDHWLEFARRG